MVKLAVGTTWGRSLLYKPDRMLVVSIHYQEVLSPADYSGLYILTTYPVLRFVDASVTGS